MVCTAGAALICVEGAAEIYMGGAAVMRMGGVAVILHERSRGDFCVAGPAVIAAQEETDPHGGIEPMVLHGRGPHTNSLTASHTNPLRASQATTRVVLLSTCLLRTLPSQPRTAVYEGEAFEFDVAAQAGTARWRWVHS